MQSVSSAAEACADPAQHAAIASAIEHASHLLPTQGPIRVFVHHNTLHAFEHLRFSEGVLHGLEKFGCQPYFSETRFHEEMRRGRIRLEDLEAVLIEDLGDEADRLVACFGTRFALRLAMLRFPIQQLPVRELEWLLSETNVLRQPLAGSASDSDSESTHAAELWEVCRRGVTQLSVSVSDPTSVPDPTSETRLPLRHRDWIYQTFGTDLDGWVHDVLIRYCSVFLDQGFAPWELVERDQGFLKAFITLYASPYQVLPSWMQGLPRELRRIREHALTAMQVIEDCLQRLGVKEPDQSDYIEQSLLALRGWAGMIWQMETAAPWTPVPMPTGTLHEFLAVRLILDCEAVEHFAKRERHLESIQSLNHLKERIRKHRQTESMDSIAYSLFQIASLRQWKSDGLKSLSQTEWRQLVREFSEFTSLERRRVFQLAYERRYRVAALDALKLHSATRYGKEMSSPPLFQAITCIDDREESFRRHLEEVEPRCETFGAAGFFAVVMYYRGASEAHYRPLCPINVVPKHFVQEEPLFSAIDINAKRTQWRRRLGKLSHQIHSGSRTVVGGMVTGIFGSLATFPLVARILAPRIASQIRGAFGKLVRPPSTELHLERIGKEPSPDDAGLGYSIPEMSNIVVRILNDIGLVKNFSRLIFFFGHGSSSLNNPHESAYNCGACSGGRGGPNARAFAKMANDPRVRTLVAQAGINIPEEVRFVGGYHNTCSDRVEYFDLDQLPGSHRSLFREAEAAIHQARCRNALERSRRFESASLNMTPEQALEHVEERSEDLSQARPEYNHATNAMCFVGQRNWSRGLFLDRRAFLASYDPSIDDERGTIIERVLQAAIPVCGGISLEYYFSTVDPEGYGCGSKLPHNIASLSGVMTGAASDLRPGLSQQMVEIHEPLRILFVIQTTAAIMRRIIDANPSIQSLVEKEWVQLAVLDAKTSQIQLYHKGSFVEYLPTENGLPTVENSLAWFQGKRDHLGFAVVQGPSEDRAC